MTETIKPTKLHGASTQRTTEKDKLTAAEIGKLWATYMGNTMSSQVLRFFLHHVDDRDIQGILEQALKLSESFVQQIKELFTAEDHPIPTGFTDEDVNLGAPRLFQDELYLHYLKYAGKAGMSIYVIAVPLMSRRDVRSFFTNCLESTIKLMNRVNDLMEQKGFLIKPPYIPVPSHIEFVKKQAFFNGFFGHVRPLQSLEITHLYDNIQNNSISRAVLIGFCQAAKSEQVREYFVRGRDLAGKHFEVFSRSLQKEDLPSLPHLDHLVTTSTFSPFSDKLMLAHKLDMFAMRVRTYGNSLAVCARHDLAAVYARFLVDVGNYAEDGANIMIDLGYLEQPPQAADRDSLALV